MHLTVLYAIGTAALILAIVSVVLVGRDEGEWVCSQQACTSYAPGGELWAQENCGVINQSGELIEACRLVIDGQEQLIAKQFINLSAIQSCQQYACVQEVRVRPTNYTLDASS